LWREFSVRKNKRDILKLCLNCIMKTPEFKKKIKLSLSKLNFFNMI